MSRRATLLLFLMVLAFALNLRLIRIGQESFFIDEAVVARSCGQPTWHFVKTVETSPPLYFYLIKGWARAFGRSHASLRVFSALCGAATVCFIYLAARELGMSVQWSLLAAMLMATSPMAFWFSQQARHYALLCLLVAAWIWLFLRVKRQGNTIDSFALAFLLILGFSTHYYFAFAVTGGLIFTGASLFFCPKDKNLLKLAAAHGAACLSWLAYFPLLKAQLSYSHIEWNTPSKMRDLVDVLVDVFPGGPFNRVPPALQMLVGTVVLLSMAIPFLAISAKKNRSNPDQKAHAFNAGFLVLSVVLPLLVPILVSMWLKPIFYKERYSIIALPAYYLLIAYGFSRIGRTQVRKLCLASLCFLFVCTGMFFNARYWTSYQDFDWQGAIRMVETEWKPGDALAFFPAWLETAYTGNGGKPKIQIQADQIPAYRQHEVRRLWLFEWEQNPSKEEQRLVGLLKKLPKQHERVAFPHMKMLEVEMP